MKLMMRQFLASTLMLGLVVGMAGCTTTRNTEIGTDETIEDRQLSEGVAEDAGRTRETVSDRVVVQTGDSEATKYQESEQLERPVAGTTGSNNARQELQRLQTNQSPDYYVSRLKDMGYQVRDTRTSGNQITHQVEKNGEQYQVVLQKNQNNRISSVNVRDMDNGATAGNRNRQDRQAIVQRVKNMQTGKDPIEYLTQMDRLGRVTEYRVQGNQAVVRLQDANNKMVRVTMQLDPQSQTVSNIRTE